MIFPEHARFRTKDPGALATDLEREHRTIRSELVALQSGHPVTLVTASPWPALAGDVLLVQSTRTITLPALGQESARATVTILRKAGTLHVVSDTTATINGSTGDTFSTAHRIVAQFDGIDWWAT